MGLLNQWLPLSFPLGGNLHQGVAEPRMEGERLAERERGAAGARLSDKALRAGRDLEDSALFWVRASSFIYIHS